MKTENRPTRPVKSPVSGFLSSHGINPRSEGFRQREPVFRLVLAAITLFSEGFRHLKLTVK